MDCHLTQQHPDMDFPANIPVFGLAGCRISGLSSIINIFKKLNTEMFTHFTCSSVNNKQHISV